MTYRGARLMMLRIYLAIHRISITDFAKKINYTRNAVGYVVNERRRASKKMAQVIEQATNGEVTAKELLELEKKN